MTELAVINKAEELKLAALLGATEDTSSNSGAAEGRLPILKINSRRKDENGRKLEQGLFVVTGTGEEPVYAEKVNIRVLSQMFQWIHFDSEEGKLVNKTLQIPNFKHEARDIKGTVRCGKPPSKVLNEMPKAEQKKYTDIKCNRILRILVSYTGKDADGNEHTIENLPAIMFLKGANFNPFEDEVLKAIPRGTSLYDFNIEVSAEEMENGSVVYYVLHFKPELKNKLPLDQDTYDTMLVMAQMIQKDNEYVDSQYKKAMSRTEAEDDALEALDSLDADFEE